MKKLLMVSILMGIVSTTAQSDGIENRIALRSEAVIKHELRQQGFEPIIVRIEGSVAYIESRLEGREVQFEMDRLGGLARIISTDEESRNMLRQRLGVSAIVNPLLLEPQ